MKSPISSDLHCMRSKKKTSEDKMRWISATVVVVTIKALLKMSLQILKQ